MAADRHRPLASHWLLTSADPATPNRAPAHWQEISLGDRRVCYDPEAVSLARTVGHPNPTFTEALRSAGYHLLWVVVIDGPGTIPEIDWPDRTTLLAEPVHGGTAATRNRGLAACHPGWVLPLDADDTIEARGLVEVLADQATLDHVGWMAVNRVRDDRVPADNGRTCPSLLPPRREPTSRAADGRPPWEGGHWIHARHHWPAGQLEEHWASPFVFHPNSLLVRRDLVFAAGGWPATIVNEDLGLCLRISSLASGAAVTPVVVRYRVWDAQTVAAPWYRDTKAETFDFLGATLNADRALRCLAAVEIPAAGPACGIRPSLPHLARPGYVGQLVDAVAGQVDPAARRLAPAALESAAARVAQAWELVHAMCYDQLGPLVVQLLAALEGSSDPDHLNLAAQSYQIASAMLAKLGEPVAACVAGREAVDAAERAGDRCLALAGRFRLAHALADAGYTRSAADVLDADLPTAADSDDPTRAATLEVLAGACECLRAVLEARTGNAAAADRHLERAALIARDLQVLPAAPDPYGTEFGVANVGVHRVAVALELGQSAHAVAVATTIDTTGLSVERRAQLRADVDRARTQVATSRRGHADARP